MAITADGRIALSATGQLHGTVALTGRKWSIVKFSNGELMGERLKYTKLKQRTYSNAAPSRVCMSVTADIAVQTKVSLESFVVENPDSAL